MELEYLQALLSGNLTVVNAFLNAGMPVDQMFHIGSNTGAALHLAASTGQVAVVNRLLEAQADLNCRQLHGATPLFLAAEFGHAKVAEQLLKSGANADLPRWDSGDTPLHMASDKGHTAVVDQLVSAGADVNLQQEAGCTPIYMAAQNGHTRVVDRLLSAGADIDWQCRENGNSALHAATQDGHIRIVCSLVRAAASVNLANRKGETALHFAAQNGQLRIVKTLLKAGADACVRAGNGCSPIHTAAQNGNLSVVKALITAHADVNAIELEGASPLYIAAQNGHQRVIKTLVEAQAIVDHRRTDGVSTLYIAAQEGHHEVVSLLVRHGAARLNMPTGTGEIPLHIAAQRGDHATICGLLQAAKGVKVDLQQKDGCTSLYLAAQFGHQKVVEILIMASADVNLKRKTTGQGPLHAAAENNRLEVAEVLIRGFADIFAKDRDGRTPIDLARKLNHKKFTNVLERAAGVPSTQQELFSGALSDSSSNTAASNLADSGSSQLDFSKQLHEALAAAGFVQSQAALQSSCADALQRILRQRLRCEEVFIVGSYSEGWGNNLNYQDGRTDPESDIDVMQLIQGRNYHLKGVCQCGDAEQELVVNYANGHIICSGYASSPARPENGSALRPAVDRVSACRLCCYPPIGPLQPQRLAKSNIPQSVLKSLRREVDASLCHVVHAAPPGQAGKQLRVSTTFLERRLLRSLSTLQGQLFVTLKFIVKKVISRRVQGLKAYHAKTITFRMLEETPAEQWRPENLTSLVRQSLQMLLDCVERSRSADNIDGRIMEHFFLIDAGLYLKGADRSDTEKIVEVLRGVIDELSQLLMRFKESLRPIDTGSVFHFHPFLILPEIDQKFSTGLQFTDYYNIYDIVRDLFYSLSELSSIAESLGCLIDQLPDCARSARVCLVAMLHLKFGNLETAVKVLMDCKGHRVSRGVRGLTGASTDASAESAVFHQLLNNDLAWKFSLMYLTRPDYSHFLPSHLAEWFPLRMENYDVFYFVNFDALRICLSCELLPKPGEVLQPWLLGLLQRDDADVLELLTALHYCPDENLTMTVIEKFQPGILDSELTSNELQRFRERQLIRTLD